MHTRFIELAGEINASMPSYVVNKLQLALNQHGKSVNNSKILIVGLAYKKNIDDARGPRLFVLLINCKNWVLRYSITTRIDQSRYERF